MKPFLLLLSLISVIKIEAQTDQIYNETQPQIFSLWHRVADFTPQLRAVESAELSPDGRYAVSGSKFGYKVMLWQVADGKLLWENQHESEVECVVFSPNGQRIATGGEDYYVRIWDVQTGAQLYAWEHDSGLDGITWSHNGQFIASGSEAGDAFIWDANTYQLLGKINAGSTINSLQFTKDDQYLAVGGNIQYPDPKTGKTVYDGFAKLIEVEKLKVIREFKGPKGSVKSIRISNNEKWLATGGFDNAAYLFNFETGKLIHKFAETLKVEAIAFSADSQYLLVGGHELKIKFYRTADLQLAYELPCPRTEYIDVSNDGRLLLTAHEDSGLISLYMFLSDTQTNKNYHQIADKQLNNRDLNKKE